MKMKGSYFWSRWIVSMILVLTALVGTVWAGPPIQVWVQPNGDNFATAYVVTGESRTYFGRAEGGGGAYEYKWEFSDGVGNTGFMATGNARYIEATGKSFTTSGTQWAKLTVRDTADTTNFASAQIDLQVIAVASDNLNRQKNSAIDRGLRYMYINENVNGSQSYWNGGNTIAGTGMALVAFENHGHNLQAPDSDIYKKSVQRGVQYLLENATKQTIGTQRCIGDPEANDGDASDDSTGVLIGGDDLYTDPIAVLALVNSCDKAFAQSYVAATATDVNGMTMYDIVVDAKDWLAWAQGDGNSSGSSSASCNYNSFPFTASYSNLTVSDIQGYFYSGDIASMGGCGGTFTINWGDGTTSTYVDNQQWCGYYGENTAYPELSYYPVGPTHTYAIAGSYAVSFTYTANNITTSLCGITVTVSDNGVCSASDAANAGWRYGSNYGSSDNSVTQWPVLALSEAKNRWGIDVNPLVVDMLNYWLAYSQCSDGGFGYDAPNSWCNYPKSAAGLIMLNYAGKNLSDAPVQSVLSYLNNNWSSINYDGNFNNHYAMYGLYKAMKVWKQTTLGSHNWEQEYDQNLINRQNSDGSWYDQGSWFDQLFATYTAVAILAPEVATLPPVADAGGTYPDVNPNQVLSLDGSRSRHQDPAKHIVLWQWDFDASNGLWWDTKATPDPGEGAVGISPTVSYPDLGHNQSYTVTLRITDDSTPTVMRDTDTAVINVTTGNVAPVPVTNGPWSGLPGTAITFDGSASYDPNACTTLGDSKCLGDHIVKYEWDINGDGIFNNTDGSDGTPVIPGDWKKVTKTFTNPVSLPAKLRVTDSFGLQASSTDSLNIVSIAIVYGQQYETCFRQTIDRFTERLGLRVKFKNQGNVSADNLVMTLTNAPTNLTILKSVANLGNLAAGAEVFTACDPNTKVADIELKFDRRISPTSQWRWRASFNYNNTSYTVDNIPALGP